MSSYTMGVAANVDKKKNTMTLVLTKAVRNEFYLRRQFAEMVIAIIEQKSLKSN